MKRLAFSLLMALLALMTSGLVVVNWHLMRLTEKPIEDPYWAISQYEVALLRLRGDVYRVMIDPSSAAAVRSSIALGLSKSRVITRESPSRSVLLEMPVFADHMDELIAFEQRDLEPALAEFPNFNIPQLLEDIDDVLGVVSKVSPEVWQLQIEARDSIFKANQTRTTWNAILSGAFALLAALSLGMLWLFTHISQMKSMQLAQQTAALEKQTAELEEQTAELESTIVEKNRFMGVVSHELKSPLQTILLSAESLGGHMSAQERVSTTNRLKRAAVSLDLQLKDLLTLARSESGKLEYRPDVFEVRGLLEEIVDIESQAAYDKQVDLYVHAPDEPVFVAADSGRLAQILRNLVSNAIKYTDAGRINVSLSKSTATELMFRVTDTGPGMPSGFVPDEIQPFKRFGALDTREGYGIGLMIAYSLAQYLGGRLNYVSDETGTTFTLTVPATLQPDLPLQSDPHMMRILLVDDMPDLLSSLRQAFAAQGIEVDVAGSAAVAANLMVTTHYDAALIDINMPIRRGDELAQDFRRGRLMANKKCQLIGMSADRHPHLSSPKSPFDLILEKPVQITKLLHVLQHQVTDST